MRSPKGVFDLRTALSEEVRAAMDEFNAVAEDPMALHRCRVRLKRARALARVGGACAPGLSAVFVDSVRPVMRSLAPHRELLALRDTARAMARSAPRKTAAALASAADSLDSERAGLPELNAEAIRVRLKDLLALALVWPEASARQIRRGARRVERRARRARERWRAALDPSVRHAWRKREKDRYYAAMLLDDAWPGRRRRRIGLRLGDALGDERDAALLMDRIAADPSIAGGGKPARRALKALSRRRRRLARRADALGARLRREAA
jgi:CHAD domain-containing protein